MRLRRCFCAFDELDHLPCLEAHLATRSAFRFDLSARLDVIPRSHGCQEFNGVVSTKESFITIMADQEFRGDISKQFQHKGAIHQIAGVVRHLHTDSQTNCRFHPMLRRSQETKTAHRSAPFELTQPSWRRSGSGSREALLLLVQGCNRARWPGDRSSAPEGTRACEVLVSPLVALLALDVDTQGRVARTEAFVSVVVDTDLVRESALGVVVVHVLGTGAVGIIDVEAWVVCSAGGAP